MRTYIVKRIGQILPILTLIFIFTSILMLFILGDPICAILGEEVSQEEYGRVYYELKPDQPAIGWYFNWLGGAVQGDWGQSVQFHKSTLEVLNERILITMFSSLNTFVISIPLGILFGVTSAVYRGRPADTAVTLIVNITTCLPQFQIALLVMYIFAMKLGWLPSYGFTQFSQNSSTGICQTIMPLFCLASGGIATTTRQVRFNILEVIRQDYAKTAKGKGLSSRKIIHIHAFKNTLISVIIILGMRLGSMLASSMFVESVFDIPGMGSLFVKAIQSRDIPVVQAYALVATLVSCTINLFTDILYAVVDPRVRCK